MVNWSDLSDTLQSKCVNYMSFLSRSNLRDSSKSSRLLVDSVVQTVPRVRFGEKKGRFLVVIYTGIDEFVRWEFRNQKDERMVIERTDSSNPSEGKFRKTVRSFEYGTFLFARRAFIHYLSNRNLELGTLEIGSVSHYLDKMVEDVLSKYSLNFHKISYDCAHHDTAENPRVFFKTIHVKNQESFSFCLDYKSEKPIEEHQILFVSDLFDTKTVKGVKVTSTRSMFFVKYPSNKDYLPLEALFEFLSRTSKSIEKGSILNVSFPNMEPFLAFDMFLDCPGTRHNLDNGIQVKRLPPENSDFSHRFYITPCGFYVQMYRASLENEVEKLWPYPCGMGNLCPTHADPFELWYYTSIPHRVLTEPYWTDTIDLGVNSHIVDPGSDDEDDDVEAEMMDEDYRERVLNAMRNYWSQDVKGIVEMDSEGVKDSGAVKKVVELGSNSEDFKDFKVVNKVVVVDLHPEDVQDSGAVQEVVEQDFDSEDVKDSEVVKNVVELDSDSEDVKDSGAAQNVVDQDSDSEDVKDPGAVQKVVELDSDSEDVKLNNSEASEPDDVESSDDDHSSWSSDAESESEPPPIPSRDLCIRDLDLGGFQVPTDEQIDELGQDDLGIDYTHPAWKKILNSPLSDFDGILQALKELPLPSAGFDDVEEKTSSFTESSHKKNVVEIDDSMDSVDSEPDSEASFPEDTHLKSPIALQKTCHNSYSIFALFSISLFGAILAFLMYEIIDRFDLSFDSDGFLQIIGFLTGK